MTVKTWNVFLRGEDGLEFTTEVEADTVEEAFQEAEDRYPEGTILEVFEPVERAREIYLRAQRDYEDDYRDNYDY